MRSAARSLTPPIRAAYDGLDGAVVLFPMSSDKFCELPISETVDLQLLGGQVIAMSKPRPVHQGFVLQLAIVVSLWIKPRKLGRLYPEVLVKLNNEWTPAPDLCFVSTKNLKRIKDKRIEGPVDLAIEILSPSTRHIDRTDKFEAYARFGVTWYWIIDLKKRSLEEYKRKGDTYGDPVIVPFDRPFEPRLFPGLVIDLAALES